MVELLGGGDLPDGFEYPREFLRVVNLRLLDLEPWLILEGEQLLARHHGLSERFPDRLLVPFARRQDNDDIACWDLGQQDCGVAIVHDFASPGWERRAEYPDFNSWLRQAVEDLIDFA